jgi:putative transposase
MSTPIIYRDNNINNIPNDLRKEYFERSEQIWIKYDKRISKLCHISKNLYNEANFQVRKEYDEYKHYMEYSTLDNLMKDNKNYRKLPAQTAQQVLKQLDENWKRYFENKQEYKINPGKFTGKPNKPGYLDKDGEFLLIFTDQQVWNVDGDIRFPKKVSNKNPISLNFLKIKTRLKGHIKQLKIVPMGVGYIINLIYIKEVNIDNLRLEKSKDRIIGIDLGVNNTIAVADNIGNQPIIVKGGIIKAINQFYNKMRAKTQSIYDRQPYMCLIKDKREICKKTGSKIDTVTHNRNKKIKDIMHKLSRYIVNYCVENNIGTIVFGRNPFWKQRVNLGKRNNQNFVQIPFDKLIKMVKYKSDEVGINVITDTEEYTSKCSFLDWEELCHHEKYIGKRITRGLFRSLTGISINADVNAAYNIIRKVFPNAFKGHGIEEIVLSPKRLSVSDLMSRSYEDLS